VPPPGTRLMSWEEDDDSMGEISGQPSFDLEGDTFSGDTTWVQEDIVESTPLSSATTV